MGRNVSLVLSILDRFSEPLSKAGKSLDKVEQRVRDLGGKVDELNKKKASLAVDADRAQKELKAAKKALDDTQESADRLAKAQYSFENIQSEIRMVTSDARDAERQLDSLRDSLNKGNNRAGGGILSQLGQAGAFQLVGEVASQAIGTGIASALGSEASTMFSSVLGMAGSGAAIGSMIAPGVGTAIGAGAGALLGAGAGALQNFQSRDDYFKSYYQGKYQEYEEEQAAALASGTTTAAQWEQSQLAFSTLLGSEEEAKDFLAGLQDFAARTPFSRNGLEAISKALIASGVDDTDEQFYMMSAVGEAGSAVGLSEESMAQVATYLGRMNATDKVTLEYLNPLLERGIPAIEFLAENLKEEYGRDYTTADIYDMISKGELSGSEAMRVITHGMANQYEGSMEAQAGTYNGLTSTLEDAQTELDAAMGQGYMEARKPALEEQIDYLSGETGEEMKRMYSLIGEFQASLENEKEAAIREAMENVINNNEDYAAAAAAGNGAEMGRLLALAKAEAEKAYMESDEYDLLIDTQKRTIQDVRSTLEDSYWDAGYELGQEFTKGVGAAAQEQKEALYGSGFFADTWGQLENRFRSMLGMPVKVPQASSEGKNHASGLPYVPYDGYPALLHEGERVLTARENRGYGAGVNVTVTGNQFTVREEADVDKIAGEICRKILEAKELLV